MGGGGIIGIKMCVGSLQNACVEYISPTQTFSELRPRCTKNDTQVSMWNVRYLLSDFDKILNLSPKFLVRLP